MGFAGTAGGFYSQGLSVVEPSKPQVMSATSQETTAQKAVMMGARRARVWDRH